jgi:hypothetical protein
MRETSCQTVHATAIAEPDTPELNWAYDPAKLEIVIDRVAVAHRAAVALSEHGFSDMRVIQFRIAMAHAVVAAMNLQPV